MADEIELTELTDIQVVRQDAVKSPASGFRFIIQKAVGANGAVNEKPDIAGANKVLALLAQLIASEAAELEAGYEDETCDIALLLDCVRSMRYFRENEMAGAEMAKDIETVNELIAKRSKPETEPPVADPIDKGAEGAPTDPETSAAAEPQEGDELLSKEARDVVAKMIEDQVAKAREEDRERIETLTSQLEVLKATPIPGGPALTATAAVRQDKAKAEAIEKAAYYRRMADSATDREAVSFYRAKLAEAERAAK